MSDTAPRKKPGKINKFLQAYIDAASTDEQQAPAVTPVKPVRKWKPVSTPSSEAPKDVKPSVDAAVIESYSEAGESKPADITPDTSPDQPFVTDELNESLRQTHFEFYDGKEGPNTESKPNVVDTVSAGNVQNDEQPEANSPKTAQGPLTKEEKAAHREANYKRLLQNSAVEGEKFEHMFNVMSRASQLCATPQTPFSPHEEDVARVGGVEKLGIDSLGSRDEEDAGGDIKIDELELKEEDTAASNIIDFDAGSVIENEDEDIQVADDTFEAPFDDARDPNADNSQVETEQVAMEGEKNKMDISSDTITTADITQDNNELSSPASKGNSSPKSRFSRSFSKAKKRFDKRKHVGKFITTDSEASSRGNEETSNVNSGEAPKVEIGASSVNEMKLDESNLDDEGNQSEFEPDAIAAEGKDNKFNFYVSPTADQFCSDSYQEGSDVSNPVLGDSGSSAAGGSKLSFYSSTDDERRSETTRSSGTEDSEYAHTGASGKFSFYSSTNNDWNGEEKKETSFDDGSEKADGRKFSFYSSTPIENASLGDDNTNNEDLINSSFLAEDTPPTSKSDKIGFYTSAPMNIESFDGSDAITSEGKVECSTSTAGEGFDDECASGILNGSPHPHGEEKSYGSYSMRLKKDCDENTYAIDGSSRSFVSFREKKHPGSRNVKRAELEEEIAQTETIGTLDTENSSPTTLIETLHAKTVDASNTSPLMKKYRLGRSLDVTASTLANYQASTSIFSKAEINSITPLQIHTYLTLEERKSIGTRVLSEKMMRGYTIAVSNDGKEVVAPGSKANPICSTCNMPMLCKNGKNLGTCVVCPTLKKKVLKRIMNPSSPQKVSSNLPGSPQDTTVSDARRELLDVSKRKSYYERAQKLQLDNAKSEWYVEGKNAVQYARDVLADRVVDVKVDNGNMSPRILFPDDGSVEVQVMQSEIHQVAPPTPSTMKTPSRKGRPPLPPQTPPVSTVKIASSQQSTSIGAGRTDAKIVASDAVSAIQQQIKDTKGKLLNTQDPSMQIIYSDLLTKLNGALIAVKKLEVISKQFV